MPTITRNQLYDGVVNFIEKEMIPLLPEKDHFQAIAALILVRGGADALVAPYLNHPFLKVLGISGDADTIDIEKVYGAYKTASKIKKFKPIDITVPLIGATHHFTFKSDDIEKLYTYLSANMVETDENEDSSAGPG